MAGAVTDVVDAERIKEIRGRYGLSQRSFAKVLGIGEASMVRYEKGIEPSKANANLIRAAENPRFVLGCLERDGEDIPTKQRKQAESYIYEWIDLNEKPEDVTPGIDAKESPMDRMSQIYQYVIQQEVLNEQAANIVGTLIHYMMENGIDADDEHNPIALLCHQLFEVKSFLISEESRDDEKLEEVRGWLKYTQEYVNGLTQASQAA